MTTLLDVVAEARTWIDTPYRHMGRRKGIAVDCVGLMFGVGEALGLQISQYEVVGYSRMPDRQLMLKGCDRFMQRVLRASMRPGHVAVLMRYGAPQHMGIVADYMHGGLSMIHALGSKDGRGRVVEQRLSTGFAAQVVQVYCLPGVNDA